MVETAVTGGLRGRTRLPVGLAESLAILRGQMEETWVGTLARGQGREQLPPGSRLLAFIQTPTLDKEQLQPRREKAGEL